MVIKKNDVPDSSGLGDDPTSADVPAVVDSPDQRRIKELEAQLETERKRNTALTVEQLRIKELEDTLARERGAKDSNPQFEDTRQEGDKILIHFLKDGLSALGNMWHRGQELEFTVGSRAYLNTKDKFGRSWLDLVDNEGEQMAKFGEVMFRRGPWPGKPMSAVKPEDFEKVMDATITAEDIVRAEQASRKQGRNAPHLAEVW